MTLTGPGPLNLEFDVANNCHEPLFEDTDITDNMCVAGDDTWYCFGCRELIFKKGKHYGETGHTVIPHTCIGFHAGCYDRASPAQIKAGEAAWTRIEVQRNSVK